MPKIKKRAKIKVRLPNDIGVRQNISLIGVFLIIAIKIKQKKNDTNKTNVAIIFALFGLIKLIKAFFIFEINYSVSLFYYTLNIIKTKSSSPTRGQPKNPYG